MVEIKNNGHGIPEDIQGRVFEAFFTTKPSGKGTGLGLEITYGTTPRRYLRGIRAWQDRFTVRLPVKADYAVFC